MLSMPSWFSIKFNNTFVFLHPEPPIINILYGLSGIYGQLFLCFMFIECNSIDVIIKIDHLYVEKAYLYCFNTILPQNGQTTYFLRNKPLTAIISLLHTLTAGVLYGYVSILSNVCNLLSYNMNNNAISIRIT